MKIPSLETMIAAHSIRKIRGRFGQSCPHLARLLPVLLAVVAGGCQTPCLGELTGNDIEVRLDSGSKAHMPGRKIKFFVDLVNQTASSVDVSDVKIELRASPRGSPEIVSLRHSWRYNWSQAPPLLRPGRRMTIPVVPEQGVEFPLEILSAGDYEIVAVVNERFSSGPYPLVIVRPDLSDYSPYFSPCWRLRSPSAGIYGDPGFSPPRPVTECS